jgi:hypothetical protein
MHLPNIAAAVKWIPPSREWQVDSFAVIIAERGLIVL